MTFHTINPSTEEVIREYSYQSIDEIDAKITLGHQVWLKKWRKTTYDQRSGLLIALSEKLKERKQQLAETITAEMGKSIKESLAEIDKCAWVCEYFAEYGEKFLQELPIETEATSSYVHYSPLGIIFGIMPWNFPFWQVFRFAAPTLMAGNCVLIKHSPNTTQCALEIQKLFFEAGFDKGVYTTLIIDIPQVENVVAHTHVAATSLTGSVSAGRSFAAICGKYLKKTVLELGGSDPYIILEDADLDLSAQKCIQARLLNNGQSCISAKRFIVKKEIKESFLERIIRLAEQKNMGYPMELTTDLGPMARLDLKTQLEKQVTNSIQKGADIIYQSKKIENVGYYHPIIILGNIAKGSPAYGEELFGPVISIIEVNSDEEAIAAANDRNFGLGASIFTSNLKKATEIAQNELQAGSCFINEMVKSDPRLPFGGIKDSGWGRELSSFGIREFVNVKSIYRA